jgi:hypothetical protein
VRLDTGSEEERSIAGTSDINIAQSATLQEPHKSMNNLQKTSITCGRMLYGKYYGRNERGVFRGAALIPLSMLLYPASVRFPSLLTAIGMTDGREVGELQYTELAHAMQVRDHQITCEHVTTRVRPPSLRAA